MKAPHHKSIAKITLKKAKLKAFPLSETWMVSTFFSAVQSSLSWSWTQIGKEVSLVVDVMIVQTRDHKDWPENSDAWKYLPKGQDTQLTQIPVAVSGRSRE